MTLTKSYVFLSFVVLVAICITLGRIFFFSELPEGGDLEKTLGQVPGSLRIGEVSSYRPEKPDGLHTQNILCIFSGRWTYLRISFAYLYRSLRKNGGVLDKVVYVMMMYDNETEANLMQLTKLANDHLGEEVFELWFRNHNKDTRKLPPGLFLDLFYELFDAAMKHPEKKYFKMDDDIV